jgi:hypothetical protein
MPASTASNVPMAPSSVAAGGGGVEADNSQAARLRENRAKTMIPIMRLVAIFFSKGDPLLDLTSSNWFRTCS